MFSTFEATRELLTIAASGLAGILLLGILSCLLEEFFEPLGNHGHLLVVEIQAIIFQFL